MGLPSPSPPSPPFFFNDTATTEIYTLSLHDALPICPPLSVAVAVTLRVKLVSLVGVIVRLDSVQPTTSTEVWPAVAVKVWPAPSLSVAPTGMLPITSAERVLSPFEVGRASCRDSGRISAGAVSLEKEG